MDVRAKLRREGEETALVLPAGALEGFSGANEADVLILGPGTLLISKPGLLEERMRQEMKSSAGTNRPSLTKEESDLVRKLSAIRYEERVVPATQKRLNTGERTLLDGLVKRGVLIIYKSAKYKEGVYDIPREWFHAISQGADAPTPSSPRPVPTGPHEAASSARPSNIASKPPDISRPMPISSSANVPLNSVSHLQKFGYMVLDNENEARTIMESIKDVQKNDGVKGVRGFDRRYYVLRRSFMGQHQARVLELLEPGPAHSDTIAAELKLPPAAALVLLMVLADEGEVLEKKKGMWEKA